MTTGRSTRPARRAAGAALVVLTLGVTGCTTAPEGGPAVGTPTAGVPVSPVVRPQYVALAEAVAAAGGVVWVEADLLKAWRAGGARYASVLGTVTALADRAGVAGVKIADELGYDDGTDRATVLRFLAAATHDLHARLPGRKVMVDLIVPELGCLAWPGAAQGVAGTGPGADASRAACAARESGRDPAASTASVDAYLAQGGLDVVNLSAGLRSDAEYAEWGTDRDAAMAAAWDEASRRWGGLVRLQARKALAHPGRYDGSAADAEADVRTYVDVPIAHGAKAVDVWTWSQPYKDGTYTLTDPGGAPNALTEALLARRRRGVELTTHMTPSSLQVSLDRDVAAALQIFDGVLVASGTG